MHNHRRLRWCGLIIEEAPGYFNDYLGSNIIDNSFTLPPGEKLYVR